jgi:E3 ubiquitin-protein ligase HUWE1
MRIDRSKLKKSSSDVPADCKALIERLVASASTSISASVSGVGGSNKDAFLRELQRVQTWTYGKCELFHWIDVLDLCDEVLEAAAARAASSSGCWVLSCDAAVEDPSDAGRAREKELLLWTLHFTTLLIEHSFSRHLYSSMEHLTALLASSDLDVVLAVLNLLYMFSKRSNFITRLAQEKRAGLLNRLTHLAASWGGKDNGFGLSKCCTDDPVHTFPESATTLHFEFYAESGPSAPGNASAAAGSASASPSPWAAPAKKQATASTVTVIHLEQVDKIEKSPARIMEQLLEQHQVPEDKQMLLFTYLRLAASFSDYKKRLQCVQARLQALSVLIYSNQLTDNVQTLLYSGLLEELVEVLEMKDDGLNEIKASALKALTSIIHLDRTPNFPKLNTIIDVTGASSYHGFLPVLVRNCITTLTANKKDVKPFPQPLATALFSFLYHLASYEAGGEALVSCGMLESLLKVIQWPSTELDHITFVTRAVRVIDLITNLDMQSFQTHSGLSCFINRLELEVEHCRKQQPFEIRVGPQRRDSLAEALEAEEEAKAYAAAEGIPIKEMEVDEQQPLAAASEPEPVEYLTAPKPGVTCLPQRAALLKSMLNFLKKAIQDPAFSDSIRHVMDGSLPGSLKHIISNAEYYGPSLFLLATDVVTAYVFQEPSLLSSLQDKGLTDVVLHALLVKDVPATREVLGSLPNVFSALCLNNRGLDAFVACKPFERLFKVLLSPDYLPAMRRRRSSDPMGDTASNLGNAMDELMRHQPTLKPAATKAIISLLEEVCIMGKDPKYVCWKANSKVEPAPAAQVQSTSNEGGSSDEEDDDEEEQSSNQAEVTSQAESALPPVPSNSEKEPVPLVDYIHNVMKFVDAILSNNSTDDHCREFVTQGGLVPLMGILGLPNLPIDFPTHQACQAVSAVSKSILNLSHEPQVLKQGLLHLNDVLKDLEPLHKPLDSPGGSVLLRELISAPDIGQATSNPQATPLLHHMSAAHAYIQMFVHVCRTGQTEIRSVSIGHWGSDLGLSVLKGLSRLYTSLVWESTVLLALCSEDTLPPGCEFGKADMDKLLPPNFQQQPAQTAAPATSTSAESSRGAAMGAASSSAANATGGTENEETFSPASGTSADSNSSVTAAMENLSTDPELAGMEIDGEKASSSPTAATSSSTTVAVSSTSSSAKEKPNAALHYQIKQIKPLLSGSSRLGRALAELFALLVKLCVGSPLRQRRGQQVPPTPVPPSVPARAVATALTRLLASGLSWEPPPTSPVPRFRLTFFICSVGFTAPMLFDEKKFPYHLMLMKFISSGGQKAFFDTFYWALSCGGAVPSEEGLEHPDLPDGTGEFLDSWLLLLEKMVNPKTVQESPHTLPAKATGNLKPFDPMKYLSRTHRMAFLAVMKIWGKKPLKVYGARMAESVLSILCHILKGEKLIEERMEKEKAAEALAAAAAASKPGTSAGGSALSTLTAAGPSGLIAPVGTGRAAMTLVSLPEPAEPEVNQTHVTSLMDMGFPRERCIEALQMTDSMEQATEYLLNYQMPSLNSLAYPAPPAAPAAVAVTGSAAAPEAGDAVPTASGGGEQDELMRAIAMSLGENVMVSTVEGGANVDEKKSEEDEDEKADDNDFTPLEKSVIEDFTESALCGCLTLLDTLPDTVYRVCDLLLAVFARNGLKFKEKVLRGLIDEVGQAVSNLVNQDRSKNNMEAFTTGVDAQKAAARIHLFTLLFEDCKILCAKIVHESRVVSEMTALLDCARECMEATKKSSTQLASAGDDAVPTPKWMTPMLLFIDLHEKVLLGMNRRAKLSKVCLFA